MEKSDSIQGVFEQMEQELIMRDFTDEQEKMAVTFTVRMDKWDKDKLEEIAKEYEQSAAEVARRFLRCGINHYLAIKMDETK